VLYRFGLLACDCCGTFVRWLFLRCLLLLRWFERRPAEGVPLDMTEPRSIRTVPSVFKLKRA
jgi:hypothetical protein